MKFRTLGKTGLRVSVIGIGTWQLGGMWNKQFSLPEVQSMFAVATELGINFVDTAECYGDHLAEQLVGASISGDRDRWIVATKFGHNLSNGLGDENFGPDQVRLQLESSLRALGTDYIDVYQVHSPTNALFENDALWTMLDKQVQAGKVRYLGNSLLMPQMRNQIEKSPDYGISVLQTTYNAIQTIAADTALPAAADLGLGVVIREPLASGFLSGKYQPGDRFAPADVRSMRPVEKIDEALTAAGAALREKPADVDPVAWANAWCLRHPAVSTVIPGVKSVAQLRENAQAWTLVEQA